MILKTHFYLFLLFFTFSALSAQQVIDSTFFYKINNPAYHYNKGPIILIDEYHNNDMSIDNRMLPFIKLLKEDGYRLKPLKEPISKSSLQSANLLVVIGAIHKTNVDNWKLPTPDAISDVEVNELLQWIDNGGSLLLVADHMPFPGAIKNLSTKLGVDWYNGFVIDSINWGMSIFSKKDGTLRHHPLLNGRSLNEKVNSVFVWFLFVILLTGAIT